MNVSGDPLRTAGLASVVAVFLLTGSRPANESRALAERRSEGASGTDGR